MRYLFLSAKKKHNYDIVKRIFPLFTGKSVIDYFKGEQLKKKQFFRDKKEKQVCNFSEHVFLD